MAIESKLRRIGLGLALSISLALFLVPPPEGSAHDFWIEQSGKDLILIFGHGDQREDFDISRVKTAKAFSLTGGEIEIRREKKGRGLRLQPAEPPSWILVEIDNGYWSKTIYGWKNLPKRKASRVVEANRSLCYAKTIITWDEGLRQPAGSSPLDIVPLQNPLVLKAGDSLPIRVFFRGKPLPNAEIEGREHDAVGTSDNEGSAKVRLSKGIQVISVDHREPIKDDPDADFISHAATLTFEVTK